MTKPPASCRTCSQLNVELVHGAHMSRISFRAFPVPFGGRQEMESASDLPKRELEDHAGFGRMAHSRLRQKPRFGT